MDVLNAVFNKLPDYELEYEVTDFGSVLSGLNSGNYQIGVNNFSYNEDRGASYLYSYPYDKISYVFVTKKGGKEIKSFEDAAGLSFEGGTGISVSNAVEAWNEKNPDKAINITYSDADTSVFLQHVVAIIGPSGTGKSTFLRCVDRLEKPETGTITIDGETQDLAHIHGKDLTELRKKTGMVFQNFNLFSKKTALQNVMEGLIVVKKMKKEEAERIAREQLKNVGLLDHANHYPRHMSGGQQQRVAIARALAMEPKLLLLESDVRLYVTLVRFDCAYYPVFRLNKKLLRDYPNLWAYARDLYQTPGFGDTTNFAAIKKHYHIDCCPSNEFAIVPNGPDESLWLTPHGREKLSGK